MDRWRFGQAIRALRQRRGWRQVDLAAAANLSRSVVGRVERGEVGRIAWADLVAVADAAGARLELDVRWRGEGIDRLLDERHAATVDAIARLLRGTGWDVDVEVSFSSFGERGSIDVLGRHRRTGRMAVFEAKSSVPDANQTVIGLDRKARLAPAIARERGWPCRGVARFLVIADGSTSRSRVARHAGTFDAAFPVRGRACLAWLRSPAGEPRSGLFFVELRDARGAGIAHGRSRIRQPAGVSPNGSGSDPPG